MSTHEKIKLWAKSLTKRQTRRLLVQLIDIGIEEENIGFDYIAPYWKSTGEPLIKGMGIFKEEEIKT